MAFGDADAHIWPGIDHTEGNVRMSDYDCIAEAIAFIVAGGARQPGLDEVAAHVQMSPFHFQRLFRRWAGVTPKRFLQVLTVERAKALLRESWTMPTVSDAVGLSSGSRLYDHFVRLEAVSPGEYKLGGQGEMSIDYGVQDTPFGSAFIAMTPRGVCRFAFPDDGDPERVLCELGRTWTHAECRESRSRAADTVEAIFAPKGNTDRPLSLHVAGTSFQVNVWRALLRISPARVTSYARVAEAVGHHGSARAVGQAVGANPVAFLIPCHRVIRQSGAIGGYHWGLTRKHAMHAWESAREG